MKITADDVIPLENWPNMRHLAESVSLNRATHNTVSSWVPLELLKSPPSRFNYGVPERIISKLNLKIDNSPIIADLISSIVVARDSEIRYLEIGTSIGKTAYLVMALASAIRAPLCCFCLDIEEINPEFARMTEILLRTELKKISFEQEIFPKRLAIH